MTVVFYNIRIIYNLITFNYNVLIEYKFFLNYYCPNMNNVRN